MSRTNGDSKKMDIEFNSIIFEEEEKGMNFGNYGKYQTISIFPDNLEFNVGGDCEIIYYENFDKVEIREGNNTKIINFQNLKEKREEEKLHSKISEKRNKTINYNKNKNNTERAI